eukprot:CAMPEP_0117582918 /NCGR_PEP_ID=MMETSP0784-20121206/66705_1 /TAXON_ID=39447 /ORGANISM="" /LENGTH=884 /DNA_ID=CAMNT_0005383505 /DNA_START=105 /DNA_END=2756 /DNA_ORIENTATION=-
MSEHVVKEHGGPSLARVHELSAVGQISGSALGRSTFAPGAGLREQVIDFFIEAFGRCGLRDEWLVATLALLDRVAVARKQAAQQPAAATGRLRAETILDMMAAVLATLKMSTAGSELGKPLKDVIHEIAGGQRDVSWWHNVVRVELRMYQLLDYKVAVPSLADLYTRVAVDVCARAQDGVVPGGSWAGLLRGKLPVSKPELEVEAPRYMFLLAFLAELAIIAAPEVLYQDGTPPVAVVLSAAHLALHAFGAPPAGCLEVLRASQAEALGRAEARRLLPSLTEALRKAWTSLPPHSRLAQKWLLRERAIGWSMPSPPSDVPPGLLAETLSGIAEPVADFTPAPTERSVKELQTSMSEDLPVQTPERRSQASLPFRSARSMLRSPFSAKVPGQRRAIARPTTAKRSTCEATKSAASYVSTVEKRNLEANTLVAPELAVPRAAAASAATIVEAQGLAMPATAHVSVDSRKPETKHVAKQEALESRSAETSLPAAAPSVSALKPFAQRRASHGTCVSRLVHTPDLVSAVAKPAGASESSRPQRASLPGAAHPAARRSEEGTPLPEASRQSSRAASALPEASRQSSRAASPQSNRQDKMPEVNAATAEPPSNTQECDDVQAPRVVNVSDRDCAPGFSDAARSEADSAKTFSAVDGTCGDNSAMLWDEETFSGNQCCARNRVDKYEGGACATERAATANEVEDGMLQAVVESTSLVASDVSTSETSEDTKEARRLGFGLVPMCGAGGGVNTCVPQLPNGACSGTGTRLSSAKVALQSLFAPTAVNGPCAGAASRSGVQARGEPRSSGGQHINSVALPTYTLPLRRARPPSGDATVPSKAVGPSAWREGDDRAAATGVAAAPSLRRGMLKRVRTTESECMFLSGGCAGAAS